MTATLVGETSLALAVSGLSAALTATGEALTALEGTVDANIGALNGVAGLGLQGEIDANISTIDGACGAGLDAQISAGLALSADLSAIVDAGAWLAGLVTDLQLTMDLLVALDADLHLDASIGAIDAGVSANVSARASLDLSLDMPDVQLALDAVADISLALDVAITAAIPGITAYVEMTSLLLGSGVAVVHFDGNLGDFGTDVDGALAGSSLPSGNATGVALVVSSSNPTTEANLKVVFGIS